MMGIDRRALLCDFAETYCIYSLDNMPPVLFATLAAGLPEDSRIRSIMAGRKRLSWSEMFAVIADNLSLIRSVLLSDSTAQKPHLFTGEMFDKPEKASAYVAFDTGEDFLAEYERIVRS